MVVFKVFISGGIGIQGGDRFYGATALWMASCAAVMIRYTNFGAITENWKRAEKTRWAKVGGGGWQVNGGEEEAYLYLYTFARIILLVEKAS